MRKFLTSVILILCLILVIGIYFEFRQNKLQIGSTPALIPDPTNTVPTSSTTSVNIKIPPVTPGINIPSGPHGEARPIVPSSNLKWGAFVGDAENSLSDFEKMVGKEVNIVAHFEGWNENFPLNLKTKVGKAGKTLLIFWEPNFGYDSILDGSKDDYIKKFSADAKLYGYPVILVPFPEMNLNEEAWGYGQNNNTAIKFKDAWIRVHNLFAGVKNVKFGLAYNNVSIPDISGNQIEDYYPGNDYVDYVGVDGFNFDDPPQTFSQIFDDPMKQLAVFHKPIYIFSMGGIAGPGKDTWIMDGLGYKVKTYPNLAGWIWFNQGGNPNWLVNSDDNSLRAFKSVLP